MTETTVGTNLTKNETAYVDEVITATMSEGKKCIICFDAEAKASKGLVNADCGKACNHWTCRECMKTYLMHCENDRKTTVVCPHPDCEVVIATELADEILERAYTPKVWTSRTTMDQDLNGTKDSGKTKDEEKNEEEEELGPEESAFTKWLAEHEDEVRQCEHCNVWICREDGCDAIQCLCGFRFCWECKMATSKCECGWEVSHFYDNIRRAEGLGLDEELATEEQLANFADYYQLKEEADNDDDEKEEEGYRC